MTRMLARSIGVIPCSAFITIRLFKALRAAMETTATASSCAMLKDNAVLLRVRALTTEMLARRMHAPRTESPTRTWRTVPLVATTTRATVQRSVARELACQEPHPQGLPAACAKTAMGKSIGQHWQRRELLVATQTLAR